MSSLLVKFNEATAARRRVCFHLVDATDGITAETGEAGGQPQVSVNGAAWTNTGIGTLSAIGNGRYYADLTQALVGTAGDLIETRYKSANTAETPGDSVQVVGFDPSDTVRLGLTALPNAVAGAVGGLPLATGDGGHVTIASGGIPVGAFAAGAITAASLATDAGAEIADAVWDEALAGHATAGTAGATLSSAGSAGDPWGTLLPGSYGAGTAGDILGTLVADVGAMVVEGSTTLIQCLRGYNAALLAKCSGLETGGTPKYRDLADTKDRITLTGSDQYGNRPTVTRDLT